MSLPDPQADARDRLVAALCGWEIDETRPGLSFEVMEALIQLNTATGGAIEAMGEVRTS